MIKYKFSICLFVGLIYFVFAGSASAQTSSEILIKQLQEQIKLLQAQITELNTKLEATQKEAVATKEEIKELREEIKITRSLRRGVKGDDVKELQEFLSQFPDIYPSGSVTGFFGPSTETAVKKLQEKYGIQAIGVVGPKTITKINELLSEGAGKSGNIPPGLLTAPGIQKKLATTTESTSLYSTTTPVIAPIPTTPAATTTTATTTVVSFTVASPNGGEQWTQGGTYNITWTSVGAVPTARISIYEAGSFKEILAADVTNNGLWSWTIPSTVAVGTQYKIRVFNLVYPNSFDDSDNYFSIIAPASASSVSPIAPTPTISTATTTTATTTAVSFIVSSPNGGEQWTQGGTYNIAWISTGPANTARVSLYDADNFKEILVAETTNSTYRVWNWTVPSNLALGTRYKIRVFNLAYPNNFDESDNYFSVVTPRVFTVTSPNGGEQWVAGNTYTITWTSTGTDVPAVNIDVYKSGIYNNTIAYNGSNNGSINWKIHSDIVAGTQYKIRVFNLAYPNNLDESDNYFSISAPGSTTTATVSDTIAPSVPTGVYLSSPLPGYSAVNLYWNASTDNIGVAGYKVYQNGVFLLDVASTLPREVNNLSSGYSYSVAAYDAAGNVSAQSSLVSVATPAATALGPNTKKEMLASISQSLNKILQTLTQLKAGLSE